MAIGLDTEEELVLERMGDLHRDQYWNLTQTDQTRIVMGLPCSRRTRHRGSGEGGSGSCCPRCGPLC
jgi:hypothetical protein